MARSARHRGAGHAFAACLQPFAHEVDFVGLAGEDAISGVLHALVAGAGLGEFRHRDRLSVVEDHVLHEADIAGRIADSGDRDRFLRIDRARRLARRAGQDDGGILRRQRSSCGSREQRRGQRKAKGHHSSPKGKIRLWPTCYHAGRITQMPGTLSPRAAEQIARSPVTGIHRTNRIRRFHAYPQQRPCRHR